MIGLPHYATVTVATPEVTDAAVALPMTLTYRVRPLEAGTLPVALKSKVTYTDSERRAYERPFPDLLIEVLKAGGPLQQP